MPRLALISLCISTLLATLAPDTHADGPDASSGFLTDYAQLKPRAGTPGDFVYLAPDIDEKLGGYQAILIEQPVLSVAADSKVKGLKPDDAKLVADTFAEVFTHAFAGKLLIAHTPGEGVMVLRTGLSNIYLQKRSRNILGYLPVGFVLGAAKSAMLDDVMDKIKLAQVLVELEVVDAASGEVIAAAQEPLGNRTEKREFTSWQELEGAMTLNALRFQCRLDNTKRDSASQQDCTAIELPAEG